jgi:hypothetical protein
MWRPGMLDRRDCIFYKISEYTAMGASRIAYPVCSWTGSKESWGRPSRGYTRSLSCTAATIDMPIYARTQHQYCPALAIDRRRDTTYLFSGPEHGPFCPRLLSCVLKPCTQVGVSHGQRKDGGMKLRCSTKLRSKGCSHEGGSRQAKHNDSGYEVMKVLGEEREARNSMDNNDDDSNRPRTKLSTM